MQNKECFFHITFNNSIVCYPAFKKPLMMRIKTQCTYSAICKINDRCCLILMFDKGCVYQYIVTILLFLQKQTFNYYNIAIPHYWLRDVALVHTIFYYFTYAFQNHSYSIQYQFTMYWISKNKFVECVFHIILQSFSSDRITYHLNIAFIIFSKTNKNKKI